MERDKVLCTGTRVSGTTSPPGRLNRLPAICYDVAGSAEHTLICSGSQFLPACLNVQVGQRPTSLQGTHLKMGVFSKILAGQHQLGSLALPQLWPFTRCPDNKLPETNVKLVHLRMHHVYCIA